MLEEEQDFIFAVYLLHVKSLSSEETKNLRIAQIVML